MVEYSLEAFVQKAISLYDDDDRSDFIHFVLSGSYHSDNERAQASINPILNQIQEEEAATLTALRDYDSLIGLCPTLRIERQLHVYPLANPADTLKDSIHINYTIPIENVDTLVPVHRIPNIMLGKWDDRNMARVVFPGLYERGCSSNLTQEQQRQFYELGLLPAIRLVNEHHASEWNPTYEAEMSRARRSNGTYSYQAKIVSKYDVGDFGDHIRACLTQNGVVWAEGLFFLLNVRGTKTGNGHSMSREAANGSLTGYLDDLGLGDIYHASRNIQLDGQQRAMWFIDIGLEFRVQDWLGQEPCLLWRTDSHTHVVKEVLGISINTAARITSPTSGGYARDITSHLPGVSGCRIELGQRSEGLYDAIYIQLYDTSKALTYGPEGKHHGKAMSFANAMGTTNPFLSDRYNQYKNASKHNSSHARVEIRVPLCHALSALVDFDLEVIQNSLLSFPRKAWWMWRAYRALAIRDIFTSQRDGPGKLRLQSESLVLTAACVWLANSLHSRPMDESAHRKLMDLCLPRELKANLNVNTIAYPTSLQDDANDETHPCFLHGAIFLRKFYLPHRVVVPRLGRLTERLSFFSPVEFKFLFGMEEDDLKFKYDNKGFCRREDLPNPRERVSNKMKRTPIFYNWAEDGAAPANLFNLEAQGIELPQFSDAASDGGQIDANDDNADPNEDDSLDKTLTTLWRQYLQDILMKIPNPNDITKSYCRMTKTQRETNGHLVFGHQQNMAEIFKKCYWKKGTPRTLQTVFDKNFPPKGHLRVMDCSQGYEKTRYYPNWKSLVESMPDDDAKAVRDAVKKKFDTLPWVPHSEEGKFWVAKTPKIKEKRILLPQGSTGSAPLILVRGEIVWQVPEGADADEETELAE